MSRRVFVGLKGLLLVLYSGLLALTLVVCMVCLAGAVTHLVWKLFRYGWELV